MSRIDGKEYGMKKKIKNGGLVAVMMTVLAAAGVHGASDSWNVGGSGNWDVGGNWLGMAVPGSATVDNTDVATFSYTLTADCIITVDAPRYIGGLSFGNTSAYKYSLNTGTLYLNSGGVIQTLSGNGNHTDTINAALQISGTSAATAFFTANAASASSLLRIGAVTGSATAGNTTTLTLNGSNAGNNTVAGVISDGTGGGTLAVTKQNPEGTWVLSGANTYSGGTILNEGTLIVNGDQNGAAGGWTVSPLSHTNASCTFQSGSIIVVPADQKIQIGNTTTSGNAFPVLTSAGVVTNQGPLLVGRRATLNLNNGASWMQNGLLSVDGYGGADAFLTVNSGASFTYTSSNSIKVNPAPGNSGDATVTIRGLFTTSQGFERTTTPNTNGFGIVSLAGGTLRFTEGTTNVVVNAAGKPFTFSLASSGGVIDTGTNSLVMEGVISGSGALTKRGTGMLTLSATNTYTGATTNESGTLRLVGGDNRLYTNGVFVFARSSTLDVDATSQTLASLTVPSTGSVITVKGKTGTLIVTGTSNLEFGPNGTVSNSYKTVVNMSDLGNFTYDSSSATFRVGARSSTNGEYLNEIARTTLAKTNMIRANSIAVGDKGGNNDGGLSILYLGQDNTLKVNTINSGYSGRSDTIMSFGAGLTAPAVTLRNTDGTSPVTTWSIGNVATFAGAGQTTFSDIVDLSAGTVDAMLTTLTIGTADVASQLNRVGTENAFFTMGAGTLTASAISIGRMLSNADGTVGGTYRANGTFTLDGGTVMATNLTMAVNTITDTSSNTKTVSGTFNLSNGTLRAATVQKGAQTGTATATTTFRWVKGTIGNISGSDLIWTNIPLTLQTAASHVVDITGANTATFDAASPISGAGCPVTKTGTGTLKLCGANTFSGGTTVSNGTLAAGCNNALASGSDLTLSGGAFDAGSDVNTLDMLTLSDSTASQLLLSSPDCQLAFSGMSGTGTLTVTGTLGSTAVRFGTSDSALTGEQLSRISVNGFPAGLSVAGYLREVRGTLIQFR